MKSIHTLKQLTSEDMRLHRQEIATLRRYLFQRRQPTECFVVGNEQIVSPSVDVLIDLDSGKPRRTLLRGGLRYQFMFPHALAPRWISVQHWQDDRYWLHAAFQDDRTPAVYTRFSMDIRFRILEREFLSVDGGIR